MYTRKSGHMSTRFEKLVKLSGTNLTQSVYPMITYVQVTDSGSHHGSSCQFVDFDGCFDVECEQIVPTVLSFMVLLCF